MPVPVFGGGPETSEGWRARLARGRPNWWVILAVSLGLMALLVATAGTKAPATHRGSDAVGLAARLHPRSGTHQAAAGGTAPSTPTTNAATTTTMSAPPSGGTAVASSVRTAATSGGAGAPQAAAPSATTTTLTPAPAPAPAPTTTTSTEPSAPVAADRTQTQGYLSPPLQSSNQFGFTGAGAMQVSVVWSGNTYLTMVVSCPSGNQSVGGTSAMAASLPDASGSCLATVSEPTSESTSLTYTISIGPGSG
jgi:hypothetical protein